MPHDFAAAPASDALDNLLSRVSVKPADLVAPGPSDADIDRAVAAACRAADHGGLRPWRFLVFSGENRTAFGQLREAALAARDPSTPPAVLEQERIKAGRAPVAIVAAARLRPGHKIPVWEQAATAAAATMNLLNALHAMGWGAMWVSGAMVEDAGLRRSFGFAETDMLLGYIHVGTPAAPPAPKVRPEAGRFWKSWNGTAPNWE